MHYCFTKSLGTLGAAAIPLLPAGSAFGQESKPDPELRHIKHIVVIYQENWSFDSLYGLFPGANGLAQSSPKSLNQTDRFDQPLSAQTRSEEHTSELQSPDHLVCRLLL